ncbi:MAG: YfcC family protein [Lachnospiraceae bacterium]|nr:YfcC family protein [Lachnospiraceae bacterium]
MSEIREKRPLHPMLLMLIVLVLCVLVSYIIPAGQYMRITDETTGRLLVVPGSFVFMQRTPATIFSLLTSITRGLQEGADVIFFLFIIGGMFSILNGTGAINVGLASLLKLVKGKEWLLIPVFMILFGCGSAFCGNFEEYLVFVPLMLGICITAGFDSLTAVGIIFIAATAGYGGSITNSFTVGTAQEIAGLPLFSGMGMRVTLFCVLELISITYVLWYARFIKKNPKLGGAYIYDMAYNQNKLIKLERIPSITPRQTLVLTVFGLGMVIAVIGVVRWGFYVDELSGVFLAIGMIGGAVGGLSPTKMCERFLEGIRDMLLPAMMLGLAHSAVMLLKEANVMDTILHSMAETLSALPSGLMACGMFIFHELFNVIVPSGSAQAGITMPLMVPLSDMNGVSRQTAVLAYQLGDAFTNIVAPTGGEILAALAICRVPFGKWLRFLLPLFAIWCMTALVFLAYAGQAGY